MSVPKASSSHEQVPLVVNPLGAPTAELSSSSSSSTTASYFSAMTGMHADDTLMGSTSLLSTPNRPYRSTRKLPDKLKSATRAHLETKQYTVAVSLLLITLIQKPNLQTPVFVPPHQYLACIANCAIHPFFTTDQQDSCWNDVSVNALRYLHALLDVAGPINPPFKKAFCFTASHHALEAYEEENNPDRISDGISSIWKRGIDFWEVVGWAFTCSALPSGEKRWKPWRPWLEFVVKLLEADWIARTSLDEKNEDPDLESLHNSIFASYMRTSHLQRRKGAIHALQAILAGLTPGSTASFSEVFHNELHVSKKRKRPKIPSLDLQQDQFGDWMDDDEDEDDCPDPNSPNKTTRYGRRAASKPASTSGPVTITHSLCESMPLRLRLFNLVRDSCERLRQSKLIPQVSTHSQLIDCNGLGLDTQYIHDRLAVELKQCPAEIFQQFIYPAKCPLIEPRSQLNLAYFLLASMLPNTAKKPRLVDRQAADSGIITQPILEQCYLPHAAISKAPEENLKLSLLLESLVQTLRYQGCLLYTEELQAAVENGVRARHDRATQSKLLKNQPSKDPSNRFLEQLAESGERLLSLVDMLKNGDDDYDSRYGSS